MEARSVNKMPLARWLVSQPAGMFGCLLITARHSSLGSPPGNLALVANLARLFFVAGVALWVLGDARKRRRSLPYDFDSMVYFAWLLVVPVYLFQTRGWRAFATLGWFLLLYLAACLCGSLPAIIESMKE